MTLHAHPVAETQADPLAGIGDWVAYSLNDGWAKVHYRGSHDVVFDMALYSKNPALFVKYRPLGKNRRRVILAKMKADAAAALFDSDELYVRAGEVGA